MGLGIGKKLIQTLVNIGENIGMGLGIGKNIEMGLGICKIIPSQMEVAPLHCTADITQKRRLFKNTKEIEKM